MQLHLLNSVRVVRYRFGEVSLGGVKKEKLILLVDFCFPLVKMMVLKLCYRGLCTTGTYMVLKLALLLI